MPSPAKTWGVLLRGDDFALRIWEDRLPEGFDPWLVVDNDKETVEYILRSAKFDGIESAGDALAAARDLVPRIHGAIILHRKSAPLKLTDNLICYHQDGSTSRPALIRGAIAIHMGISATLTARDTDGNVIVSEPQPTPVQQAVTLSSKNDDVFDVLHFLDQSNSWFNLYKAYEVMKDSSGGADNLAKLMGVRTDDIKLFSHTSQMYRHRPRKHSPPARPMELQRASQLIRSMADAWIKDQT